MKKLPTLYKKTSTGKIQEWTIEVEDHIPTRGACIITVYGQVGGKLQTTRDYLDSGKNQGKKNETTPRQQAELEAESKWEKQLKKGYSQTLAGAKAEEVDELIEGGVAPMLAHKYSEHGHKIRWPALISPKLDGIRCIATITNGRATLWTRTRRPIRSMPHIVSALEQIFVGQSVILDGELYHGDYKNNFNKIISLVRPEAPVEGHEIVQYWIFDCISAEDFQKRVVYLSACVQTSETLVLVPQYTAASEEEALRMASEFIAEGYEGGMVKQATGPYEHKRSYLIQKIKLMHDDDYLIVGVEEGRGKLAGHIGSFICETSDGAKFNAKLKGELALLKKLFENPAKWKGKKLTVQYQNMTPDGIPRFPVGKAIRDYE